MFNRYKVFAAYIFAIPLALLLGVLAASPGETTFMLIGMLLFFLALPLFFTWHHTLLIIFWNSAFSAFFLPGRPEFWLVVAGLSFGLSFLSYVMGRRPFLHVPEMTRPLLSMVGVVVFTAWYRGGTGFEALGGAVHGGKFYLYILGAIIGYFAFTAGHIPIAKGTRMAGLYFVSGTTFILSNLVYSLGPAFFVLYYFLPTDMVMNQVASDVGLTNIDRITGLSPACPAMLCFLFVNYGLRGLFEWSKPWRFLLLIMTIGASFFGGFRSLLALLFLIFMFQFYFEGLMRTRLFLVLTALAVLGFMTVLVFASRLPFAVQRAVSFLPVNVDAGVRADAEASSEWRFQMWQVVWKEVPKYLVVGKGYAFDAGEMELTKEATRMGLIPDYEESMLAGNYHSGPLSILVPFGIVGTAVFLWMLTAGFRVLYANYRYGDERLRRVNTVVLSYYLATVAMFFFVFGAFNSQLVIFLGSVGLSVSLNGGMKKRPKTPAESEHASLRQACAVEL